MIDSCLAREIKREANGNGTREAKFLFNKKVREAARMLSTPDIMRGELLDDAMKEFGRVPVAICLASTIIIRRDRLSRNTVDWAKSVIALWTNRPANLYNGNIDDGLHPTRIEEYAGEFISLTTV